MTKKQTVNRLQEVITVRSALNPILWLCAIVTVPCVSLLAFTDGVRELLTALAAAPVSAAVLGFLFLLFFDRDKLQSEDYQSANSQGRTNDSGFERRR